MSSDASFPAPEEGLSLHNRILAGDAKAASDLCLAYTRPLFDWLRARFPSVDEHLCQHAVHQALIDYLQRPDRYEPDRGDFRAYLCGAARGDLLNLLAREGRHRAGRVGWESVEM